MRKKKKTHMLTDSGTSRKQREKSETQIQLTVSSHTKVNITEYDQKMI